ncbi:MAG: hypothetical protein QM726_11815 [Chitinophagaceae bacterium]
MKKGILLVLLSTFSFTVILAQTGQKQSAASQVSAANGQADLNNGKKMQQQSLNKPFEKTADSVPAAPKKKAKNKKRKAA